MELLDKKPLLIEMIPVGTLEANCVLVADTSTGRAAVIDPGGSPGRITGKVRELGITPVYIVDTHAHIDHIAANNEIKQEYPSAELCIHALDAEALVRPSRNLSLFLGQGFKSIEAERLLEDGDSICLGDITLEVLHVPGHTPGGIALHNAENKVCITGDTLFSGGIGRSDFPGGDGRQLVAGIRERLLTLDPDTIVYPGHGPETTIGQEKSSNPFL